MAVYFESEPVNIKLEAGTLIDRYGEETGQFVSPKGEPFENRANVKEKDIKGKRRFIKY